MTDAAILWRQVRIINKAYRMSARHFITRAEYISSSMLGMHARICWIKVSRPRTEHALREPLVYDDFTTGHILGWQWATYAASQMATRFQVRLLPGRCLKVGFDALYIGAITHNRVWLKNLPIRTIRITIFLIFRYKPLWYWCLILAFQLMRLRWLAQRHTYIRQ